MFNERIKRDVLHKTSLSGMLSFEEKCIRKFQIHGNALRSLDPYNEYPEIFSIESITKKIKIHKWKNIESLETQGFNVSRVDFYTKWFFSRLKELVKRPENGLRTMNLKLRKKELDIEQKLKDLAYVIGRHSKDLERLEVDFGVPFFKNSRGFLEFVKQIGLYCKNLQEFRFCFGPIQNAIKPVALRSLELFRSRIERYFSRIERLDIDMKYSFDYSSDRDVFMFVDALLLKTRNQEKIGKLTRLSMNLEDNYRINYDIFQKILVSLCELKGNLQDLTLNFSSCYIEERKNPIVENQIIRKSEIRHFTLLLNFNSPFNDKGVEDLLSDLTRNLNNHLLESLKLAVADCKKITICGFEKLCGKISEYFLNLKSLDLNFHGCRIAKDEFRVIVESLRGCIRHLEKLTLNFFGCQEVTKEGLEILSEVLAVNGKNLKEFSLTFACAGGKIEDFVMGLGRDLVGLKFLKLRILNCLSGTEDLEMGLLQKLDGKIPKIIIKWN